MYSNLGTYLDDHLAGANMAIELIEKLEQNQTDESIRAFLRHLLLEVTADRDALQKITNQVCAGSSIVKNSAAFVAAKALNLKLGAGKTPFGLFESLEFLALGILGKLHLWKALQLAALPAGTTDHADYARLIERGEAQYAEVEGYRIRTASVAFQS